MKSFKTFCLLFLLLPAFSLGYQYKLVMGTMFKNEARWLKEWIEYHMLIGVEHFYLYDNDSTDNFEEVLQPYIEKGIVELIPWHNGIAPWEDPKYSVHWVGYQWSAFNDCIKRCINTAKWVGLMDVDEFLVPLRGISQLHSIFDHAHKTNVGCITFFWKCFGTSNIWEIKQGDLITNKLYMRTSNDFISNKLGKCFYRPEAVLQAHVHEGDLRKGYKKLQNWDSQINHYQYKGRKHAFEYRYKIILESPEDMHSLSDELINSFLKTEKLFNIVKDYSIYPYSYQLQKKLQN